MVMPGRAFGLQPDPTKRQTGHRGYSKIALPELHQHWHPAEHFAHHWIVSTWKA